MENYNYGLMIYTTTNIGDEIQSIAASRFLPSIDEYISRENDKATINNLKESIANDKRID